MASPSELEFVAEAMATGIRLDDRQSLQSAPLQMTALSSTGTLSHIQFQSHNLSFTVSTKLQLSQRKQSQLCVSITTSKWKQNSDEICRLQSLLEWMLQGRKNSLELNESKYKAHWWIDLLTLDQIQLAHFSLLAKGVVQALNHVQMPLLKFHKHQLTGQQSFEVSTNSRQRNPFFPMPNCLVLASFGVRIIADPSPLEFQSAEGVVALIVGESIEQYIQIKGWQRAEGLARMLQLAKQQTSKMVEK